MIQQVERSERWIEVTPGHDSLFGDLCRVYGTLAHDVGHGFGGGGHCSGEITAEKPKVDVVARLFESAIIYLKA